MIRHHFARHPWLHTTLATLALAAAGTSPVPARSLSAASPGTAGPVDRGAANASFARLPMAFEANVGQFDRRVDFSARGRGYALWLSGGNAVFALREGDRTARVIHMGLADAASRPAVRGEAPLPGKANHLVGANPAAWHADVPLYGAVRYDDVYPGVDLMFYGTGQTLEYDFVVSPGRDVSRIGLRFDGADAVTIAPSGELVLVIAGREMRWNAPVIYQDADGRRVPVAGRYRIARGEAASSVGFEVDEYDRTRPLVIDPTIDYSTFLGGLGQDDAYDVAVSAAGEAFVVGTTFSTAFPTVAGSYDVTQNGLGDAFVSKLDAAGAALVYSTYLGGAGSDVGRGIAVDAAGNAFVAGNTDSANFPTVIGSFDTTANGVSDGFVAELNAAGNALVYSTYLGGGNVDVVEAIALDGQGRAVVTGWTGSANFPLAAAPASGLFDAFVSRISATGAAVNWTLLIGGTGGDYGYDVITSGNQAYVTGLGTSGLATTAGAFQTVVNGTADAFVAHVGGGGALLEATFVGGSGNEAGLSIGLGQAGHVFVTGWTDSIDYPTMTPIQAANAGGTDAFVTKLNATLATLTYSTYLGGSANDTGHAIAINNSTAWIAGETWSADFPVTAGALAGGSDAFYTKVNPTGTAFVTSEFLGGTGNDLARGAAYSSGALYLVGTASSTFPIVGGVQPAFGGGSSDAFAAKVIP